MNFDLTTFVLEIFNFLVLVWLLKRALYQPILQAVARRQDQIQKRLAEVEKAESEAALLRMQYESRIAQWEEERKELRAQLSEELKKAREAQLTAVKQELEDARKRAAILDEQRLEEQVRASEQRALSLAGEFASRLLTRLATPALEQKLCGLLVDELNAANSELREVLREATRQSGGRVKVDTTMPLSTEQKNSLSQSLNAVVGRDVAVEFRQDPQLIAGVAVDLGAVVLHADLKNELSFFSRANNNGQT